MIVVFMVIYYKLAGILADTALTLNIIFLIAALAGFEATLTLPGIAGIVLTLGMAVDANVLINERIREELRLGKTARAAIEAGYERALPAILDSNVTTFLAGVILFQFVHPNYRVRLDPELLLAVAKSGSVTKLMKE